MSAEKILKNPWMVAVWPGMGHVAINAGYYLMSKLGMYLECEIDAHELFEISVVDVDDGIIHPAQLPRSRFFIWRDPKGVRDLIVFLGEAQPPSGVYAYCRRIITHAKELGVERIFTFAAMATRMSLDDKSRVFAAATCAEELCECRELDLEVLKGGQISGLNGVLLGVAAERGLTGTCLLGEMPHIFAQIPFPRASLAVLETFTGMADIPVDFTDLEEQGEAMQQKLRGLMSQIDDALRARQESAGEAFGPPLEAAEEPAGIEEEDKERIEDLFTAAEADRSQAYKLKRDLDRLNVFDRYEDRFLDLFHKPGGD